MRVVAGLFQQLHLFVNVTRRLGTSPTGSKVASTGIQRWRRWWEERRTGRHHEVVVVRMKWRLCWLVQWMMSGSCCGQRQTHADGEGGAHVDHFAHHGQSGRFLIGLEGWMDRWREGGNKNNKQIRFHHSTAKQGIKATGLPRKTYGGVMTSHSWPAQRYVG